MDEIGTSTTATPGRSAGSRLQVCGFGGGEWGIAGRRRWTRAGGRGLSEQTGLKDGGTNGIPARSPPMSLNKWAWPLVARKTDTATAVSTRWRKDEQKEWDELDCTGANTLQSPKLSQGQVDKGASAPPPPIAPLWRKRTEATSFTYDEARRYAAAYGSRQQAASKQHVGFDSLIENIKKRRKNLIKG